MRQITKFIAALAVSVLLAACGSSSTKSTSSPASSKPAAATTSTGAIVRTASNSTLGANVLVDARGLTLYHLSGEQNGKWICTSAACLQAWHPLTATTDASLSASVGSLGTVKRPGGTSQVTYKGTPLYTFVGDQKPGEAKGQGIKDVGVWTAVTPSAGATSTPATPTTTPSGSSYGY